MAWVDLTTRSTRSMAKTISWGYPIGSDSTSSYYSKAVFSGTFGYKVQYDDSKDLTQSDSMRVVVDIDASLSCYGNNCPDPGSNYINVAILAWGGSSGNDGGYSNLYGDLSGAINQVHNHWGGDVLLSGAMSDASGGGTSVPHESYNGTKYVYFDYSDIDEDGELTVEIPFTHQRRYLNSETGNTNVVSGSPTWIDIDLSNLKLKYFPWAIKRSGNWISTDKDDDYTDHLASPSKAGLRIKRSNVWDACVNTTEYSADVDHGFIKRSGSWVTSILHGDDS